jgi:tripartite-type tricarboxylate transporter receptor subunit TctC
MRLLKLISALALSVPLLGNAQTFPSQPIKLLVGFSAGGGSDSAARIIAPKLGEVLGQQIIIDNRPGAGGNIATEMLVKAVPDGHTILLATVGSLAVNPHIMTTKYDPFKDLAPLSMGVMFPNVLVVPASSNIRTLADYIKAAKDPKTNMLYGSSGIGSTGHLAGALLGLSATAHMSHVAYKGGGPAMTDLVGGFLPSIFSSMPPAIPFIQSGRIRAIALTGLQRSDALPDVPTIAESGFPGYEATNWYAFVAPAKTPPEVIKKLNHAIMQALTDKAVANKLRQSGMTPSPSTPEELAAYMKKEYDVWGNVARKANIKAD